MAIEKFSLREQILMFLVVATVVGGSYGLFRFAPEHKRLNTLKDTVLANQEKVKNPTIVEEPAEDADDLQDSIDKLEAELASLKSTQESAEKNLAPIDSQEMVLKISEAAREAGIRVIASVPYVVQRKDDATQVVKKISKRKARRLAKAGVVSGAESVVGTKPKEGELVFKLVNSLENARPFQQISIDGNFTDLYQFIQSLKRLPWQATIVKLEIATGFQTPPPGISQPITAKLLIAM